MNIVLCGMMGVGKTSVGIRLAELTDRRWYDTDVMITDRHGRISDLFDVTDAAEQLQAQGYSVQCVKTVAYGVCDRCGK